MQSPPEQHKEVARFLKGRIKGEARISIYRDSNGKRPIPIGEFGSDKKRFYSTIGSFDSPKDLPTGDFEFAASGSMPWLPNVLAASIYWLRDRSCDQWPLICEDVVRENAKSTYRHMAYTPSCAVFKLSDDRSIQWLLGVPITDAQIGIQNEEVVESARELYPSWLMTEEARHQE